MPVEALLWCLLLILGPALALRFWPELNARLEWLPIDLEPLGPWVHALCLPYLGLILGSVSSRQAGLQGLTPEAWASGGLACALGLVGAHLVLGQFPTAPVPGRKLEAILLEESRWTFYRGAAALWVPHPFSVLLGLGLALVEMACTHAVKDGWRLPTADPWKSLMRAVLSTLLFLSTGSFWLTAGTQLGLSALLQWRQQAGAPRAAEG